MPKPTTDTFMDTLADHWPVFLLLALAVLFAFNGCSCHITINSTPTTQEAQ